MLDKKKHTVKGISEGGSPHKYTLVASRGTAKGVPRKSIKSMERIGGAGNHPVKRLWLPYRDIGVRWEKLSVILPYRDLETIPQLLHKMPQSEVEERLRYLKYVKPLFTSEGMYEYIVHKLSVQHGFEILATLQYCDKFSRTNFDIGADEKEGFWSPNSGKRVLQSMGLIDEKHDDGGEEVTSASDATTAATTSMAVEPEM